MSVLDRAIVKAFERQRMSAVDVSAANVVRGATDLPAPSTEMSAAANTIDSMEQLLVEIGISSSVAPPPIVVAAPVPDFLDHSDVAPSSSTITAPPSGETPQTVVESSKLVETPPPLPVPLPPPVSEVAKVPLPQVPAPRPAPIAKSAPAPVTERELARYVGPVAPPQLPSATPAVAVAPAVYVPPPIVQSTGAPSNSIAASQSVTREWKWPEICEQLDQFTGDGFRQLAKHLQFAAAQGNKVLAFVSSKPGAGRTSVLLTLTRILALEGRTDVLLVDADRRHPDLAKLTKLTATRGLSEVLHGQATLQQAVVPRTPGNISLLPLLTPISDAEWLTVVTPLRALMKQLKHDHDMVLVDAGVFGPETRLADCWLRGAADAVITISRQLTGQNAVHDALNWKQIGIESLGVIETFA